ncbi:MAG TPA: fused MFS/spermidine synthase [Thermoleophilia bacterium]|nr:fused MFS/spermidine synthase [Thermoleophilia bacterium]
MTRPAQPRSLSVLVFLAGIGSMATEMCASRLLAPYYGSSTVVWANIIGLILASLSVGYWLGGRLADRYPSPTFLATTVLAAAAWVAAIPFVAPPFLELSIKGIETLSTGAVVGSFAASLALFAPPVVLLGMVTPFAIRLSATGVADAGRVAGRVFALSTAGSLIGTFVPALITIPLIGTQRTLIGAALIIALAAVPLLAGRRLAIGLVAAGVLAALLAIPPAVVKAQEGLLHEEESQYQFIQVVQSGEERLLYLNEGYAIHSVWRPDAVLTGGEWDMFLTAPPLLGRPAARVATLGNAAGTTARAYGVYYPEARIDGVEIDPAVTDAGRRWFGLDDNPRLTVHTADARPFLESTDARYDLILIDAYRQPYVPFYLATREFFRLCRERLAPGGIVALNVSTVPGDNRLAEGVAGTLRAEFPQVVTWQALRFNQFVVGLTTPLPRSVMTDRLAAAPRDLLPITHLFARDLREAATAARPWTDDRAPVEWVTDRMIAAYALRGAATPEDLLPTAPD